MSSAGRGSWLFWSRKPTAAIWATARFATTGATAAENARRASCAPIGLRDGRLHGNRPRKGGTAPAGGSSTAGLVVDSIVFLWLAFGSLEFLPGQIVSKAWMVLLSIPFVAWLRRRDHRLGLAPA